MRIRDLKKSARASLKKHYVVFVMICFLLSFFGVEYSGSMNMLKEGVSEVYTLTHLTDASAVENAVTSTSEDTDSNIKKDITFDDGIIDVMNRQVASKSDAAKEKEKNVILGRTRGVLAGIVNKLSKGGVLALITSGFTSIAQSKEVGTIIGIFVALFFAVLLFIFIKNVARVIGMRIFLEARIYDEIPAQRALFIYTAGKWVNTAMVLLVKFIYETLWSLTIVGYVIKRYSYYMVPCIVAENPSIGPKEAITMSRRMMNGHKMELFKVELTFAGWFILGLCTLGISELFYSNAYKEAVIAEYYTRIRQETIEKKLAGYELLNDRYLFEKAPQDLLRATYADAYEVYNKPLPQLSALKGIQGFLARNFGVVLRIDKNVIESENSIKERRDFIHQRQALEGECYPERLLKTVQKKRISITVNVNANRYYSIINLITLFLLFCIIGWCWEVGLHLISDGKFVNRGMLHGPWIPIYGAGGILIMVVLNRFRKHPVLEFVSAIVLSGIVEYTTSYVTELSKGERWWDYSGYFLNLNGRICAEGLLVFGIMGMLIVYVVAPFMDQMIRMIPGKFLKPVSIIVMIIFVADACYSSKYPNKGEGITSATSCNQPQDDLKLAPVSGDSDSSVLQIFA